MDDGTEPIADDELLYRRIPKSVSWYSDSAGLSPQAFAPHAKNDITGLSVSRAKYKSIEAAAKPRERHAECPDESDFPQVVSISVLNDNQREPARRIKREAPGGFEPPMADLQSDDLPPKTQGKTGVSAGMVADLVAVETKTMHFEPDLQAVIDVWPDLPEAIKAGILAMVAAASQAAR